ncbi:hypothetical protein DFH94DRAFT_812381 [Russula ochroleuca]|uniref:Fungal STAND N-terminal Goodbye domain-containing protein n=1 Tax=Russula ochroleuca TaxID=152965 RepID=A0A9P5MM50_9AGAM|nr:hypothetical protein DFH94DRAFT_812381 [Russula ochroleuca]
MSEVYRREDPEHKSKAFCGPDPTQPRHPSVQGTAVHPQEPAILSMPTATRGSGHRHDNNRITRLQRSSNSTEMRLYASQRKTTTQGGDRRFTSRSGDNGATRTRYCISLACSLRTVDDPVGRVFEAPVAAFRWKEGRASYQVFRAPTASLPRAPSLTFLGILTFVDSTHELLRGRIAPNCSLCPTITQKSAHRLILGTKKLIAFALMSHSHLAASSSSSFQLIINNALKAYEKRTKNDLLAHPLAAQIQACDSLTAILTVLQQQIQGLDQPRSDDRWTKWLDPTVNVLFAFSATLGAGVSLAFPPANAIFTGIGVLLSISQTAKDVQASKDTIMDIFERIEMFFRRLEIYTDVPPTAQMMDTIVRIMVEVLLILGIATKEIKQGRLKNFGKKLIGKTDMEDALKRLDNLTQEEARMAVAQNLKATHGVDERVRGVANIAVAIDSRVAGVDDRVAGVDDRVARVDDGVARVDNKVAIIDDKVTNVDDKVASVDNKVVGIDARVASVDDRVVAVDDKVAEVLCGAQIIFGQV